MSVKVAITGPESTGKSWLAEHLALHYNALWVREFARAYLAKNKNYKAEDVVNIAAGQLKMVQDQLELNPPVLFADTEMLVCEIWYEFVFGLKNDFITDALKKQDYDLYLLCAIDIDWEPDPLREHPDQRKRLFELYESRLKSLQFPYRIVFGNGNERLKNAINFVNEIIKI